MPFFTYFDRSAEEIPMISKDIHNFDATHRKFSAALLAEIHRFDPYVAERFVLSEFFWTSFQKGLDSPKGMEFCEFLTAAVIELCQLLCNSVGVGTITKHIFHQIPKLYECFPKLCRYAVVRIKTVRLKRVDTDHILDCTVHADQFIRKEATYTLYNLMRLTPEAAAVYRCKSFYSATINLERCCIESPREAELYTAMLAVCILEPFSIDMQYVERASNIVVATLAKFYMVECPELGLQLDAIQNEQGSIAFKILRFYVFFLKRFADFMVPEEHGHFFVNVLVWWSSSLEAVLYTLQILKRVCENNPFFYSEENLHPLYCSLAERFPQESVRGLMDTTEKKINSRTFEDPSKKVRFAE
jgi:hypothetical protein